MTQAKTKAIAKPQAKSRQRLRRDTAVNLRLTKRLRAELRLSLRRYIRLRVRLRNRLLLRKPRADDEKSACVPNVGAYFLKLTRRVPHTAYKMFSRILCSRNPMNNRTGYDKHETDITPKNVKITWSR